MFLIVEVFQRWGSVLFANKQGENFYFDSDLILKKNENHLAQKTFNSSFCYRWCSVTDQFSIRWGAWVALWVRSLDLTAHTSLSPIRRGFAPSFVNYKKGAFDSQPQVIKLTSCLPRVGGSLRIPPPLKLVAMI